MEIIAILAVLTALAIPIAVVAILFWVSRLQGRIDALHRRIERLDRLMTLREGAGTDARPRPTTPPATPPTPMPIAVPPAKAPIVSRHGPSPERPEVNSPEPITEAAQAAGPVAAEHEPPPKPAVEAPTREKPPAAPTWEEKLGARWFVWLGGLAIALAGAYFVKFSFERGLIGPTMTIILGSVFGIVLLGVAEFLRKGWDRIAHALAGAGVAVLFACILAATRFFELIPMWLGTMLMIAVTALAVGLSLRHGWFVALLGLVGGFLTPAIIGPHRPADGQLFAYLLLLQVAMIVITNRRGWWPLAALTMTGAFLWAGFDLLIDYDRGDGPWLGLFLLASAAAFVVSAGTAEAQPSVASRARRAIGWIAVVLALLFVAALVRVSGFANMDWIFLAILCAGCIAAGRLSARFAALPWVGNAAALAMLTVWHVTGDPPDGRFGVFVVLFAVIHGLGGYGCLWGSARPGLWATLASASGIAYLLLAYGTLAEPVGAWFWGTLSVALAGVYALAAWPVLRARATRDAMRLASAALMVGAAALLALAALMELERHWITVAWALLMPAVAVIGLRLDVAELKPVVMALAGLVMVRLLVNPFVLEYPIGELPILNWLLYGYGLPVVCFAACAWLYRSTFAAASDERGGVTQGPMGKALNEKLVGVLTGGAIALGFALVTLEVRHFFHREAWNEVDLTLMELATYGVAWLLMARALLEAVARGAGRTFDFAMHLVGAAGAAVLVFGAGMLLNPLIFESELGRWMIVNRLLYIYALPAALAAWAAIGCWRLNKPAAAHVLAAAAMWLVFLFLSLEIRHGFHGPELAHAAPTLVEWATYVNVWLAASAGLLWMSKHWRYEGLRYGALLIAGAAVAVIVGALGVTANPLLTRQEVGSWVLLNWLLYAYGLPAVLVVLIVWLAEGDPMKPVRAAGSVLALILLFALVSLEVRQGFQGSVMTLRWDTRPGNMEWYSYSAAWLLLGLALLAAGIASGGRAIRWASLAVTMLAVGKVFLIDTAQLEDLYRVLSFLGLGVTLMLLSWLYQRFVFRTARTAGDPGQV